MKIKKITNKINLSKENGIELQGCYNDCTEYKLKSKGDYTLIHSAGYAADGHDSIDTMREIKSIFGVYCYKTNTCKTCIYW